MKRSAKNVFPIWVTLCDKVKRVFKTTDFQNYNLDDQKEVRLIIVQVKAEHLHLDKLNESLSAMTIVNQSVHYHNAGSISIENIEKMGAPHGKE